MIELWHGDCLELMHKIPDGSIDMILTDPPYGTTACKWDSVIPLKPIWRHLNRIIKPNGAIVMTASQPFTSTLICSNLEMFKYSLCWEKTTASGHLNAKKMPMRAHEDIVVFYRKQPTFNPQMTHGHERKVARNVDRSQKLSDCYGLQKGITSYDSTSRYPRSVIKTSTDKQRSKLHPTQKPVGLMEYLIKTYTNESEIVLDFAIGSGTTGVACKKLNRSFIGIEIDEKYYQIAKNRIEKAPPKRALGDDMKDILCKKTGNSLNLCDSKFSDCSEPIVSEYSPETETGWQECEECGVFFCL